MYYVYINVPTPDDDASIVKEVIYESDVKRMMDLILVLFIWRLWELVVE